MIGGISLLWDTSDGSILDHVVVKYGGQTYSFPMWRSLPAIQVYTSNLVVSNSTITENGDYGIYVVDASPTILDNVITNNRKDGIRLSNASPQIMGNTITGAGWGGIYAANSNPIIENNVIGDNAGWAIALDPSSSGAHIQGNDIFGPNAGILVLAGDLEASVTWNSDSVYVIDYYRDQYRKHLTVKEGATLTIEPGVVMKFEGFAKLFVKGDLIADGKSEAQIVFTSLKDDSHGGDTNGDGNLTAPAKNDWGNIVLWNTSQQSVLAHTVVMYAGRTWSSPLYQSLPAIHVLTQIFEIKDSFISENGVDGIYASPVVQSNIVIEGNIISKNGRDGIRLYNASARVVGNKLAENRYGIYLTGSPGSEVYLNNFMDNYRHALSTDSVCFWHSDRRSYTYNGNAYTNYLGNYWDDYTGTDAHGDGIGDTPYPIDSDQDSYPLMMPFENYEIGGGGLEKPLEAQLAIDVIGADYLWGGKGFCYSKMAFLEAEDIFDEYTYWNEDIWDNDTGKGLDCAGLIFWSYNKAYGTESFIKCSEPYNPVHYEGADGQYWRNSSHIETQELKLGDLLFFDWDGDGERDHVEVYVGDYYYEGGIIRGVEYPAGTYDLVAARGDDTHNYGIVPDRLSSRSLVSGFVGFRRVDEPLVDGTVYTASPVDLAVTDPDGLTVNNQTCEVPQALYYSVCDLDKDGENDDIVTISEMKAGDYAISVLAESAASPADTYSLTITAWGDTVVLAEDVAIKDIPAEHYIIRSTEDGIIPIIPATIDFDPDTLNLKSEGKWITVYIELPVGHGYDVSDINLARTFLEGLLEVQHSDVQDGVLMVKFDRQDLIIFLESVVGVIPPDDVPLTVTGELKDGRRFEGSDIVRVIKKGKNKESKGMNKKSKGKNKK